jgi:hypothetical protein
MAARNIRVRGIKRGQIDEDKLALAFLLLAKALHEQADSPAARERASDGGSSITQHDEPEAA